MPALWREFRRGSVDVPFALHAKNRPAIVLRKAPFPNVPERDESHIRFLNSNNGFSS